MQDIWRYHIIPEVPAEFLLVAKWTRSIAVKYLRKMASHNRPFDGDCIDVIKALVAANTGHKVRLFTKQFWINKNLTSNWISSHQETLRWLTRDQIDYLWVIRELLDHILWGSMICYMCT